MRQLEGMKEFLGQTSPMSIGHLVAALNDLEGRSLNALATEKDMENVKRIQGRVEAVRQLRECIMPVRRPSGGATNLVNHYS